jgi:predicted MPP superfamily phosphohydrolase
VRAIIVAAILVFLSYATLYVALRRGWPEAWERREVRGALGVLGLVCASGALLIALGTLGEVAHAGALGASIVRADIALLLPLAGATVAAVLLRRALFWALLERELPKASPAPATTPKDAEESSLEATPSTVHDPVREEGRSGTASPASSNTSSPATFAPAPFSLGAHEAGALALPGPTTLTRRTFINGVAASIPTAALVTSTTGMISSQAPQRLPIVPMAFANLPEALDGLRILHLSDLHLGYFMHVRHLEECLERAWAFRPDLVVFTGDIADELDELGDALRVAHARKPRLGVVASIGNHEHFRGTKQVLRIFDKSPVPLLLDAGMTIPVGDALLHLTGSNDPMALAGDIHPFLERSIHRAVSGAPSDAFHLLLSHRPEGFDIAERLGLSLTLSGHTHGMQIGMDGRSLFEKRLPHKYLWGPYARGQSRLYTSAGFGHWFPVRFGCPTEAPIIELRRLA